MKKFLLIALVLTGCYADVVDVTEGDAGPEEDAAPVVDCAMACEAYGMCTPIPAGEDCGGDTTWTDLGCHTGSIEECQQSQLCAEHGFCYFWEKRAGNCNSCSKG